MSRSLQEAVNYHCRFVEQILDQYQAQCRTLPDGSSGQELLSRARVYVKGIRDAAASGNTNTTLVLLEVLEWLMLQFFEVMATA